MIARRSGRRSAGERPWIGRTEKPSRTSRGMSVYGQLFIRIAM